MSNYAVTATLTAIDNFSGVFQKAGRAVQNFGNSANAHLSNIGKATMAAGAATTAMGVAALHSYGDFSNSLAQASVIAGGTSKDIDGLSDVALKMGRTVPASANQSAEAMVSMARDGASVGQIKKEFPAVAEAATAAGEDISTTASVVQNAMNIWGNSLKSPKQAAAILVQTANMSNASISDMQQALANIGGTARLAGMSMQDTSTAIGLLTNKGFSAAQASMDLSHAITMMLSPSAGGAKVMKQLGLSFTDAQGHMKPFPQILNEIADKTANMGDAQKTAALKTMFGAAGMKAIAPLLDAVKDKTGSTTTSWAAFSNQLDKTAGSTQKASESLHKQANEMSQNVGAQLKLTRNAWTELSDTSMKSSDHVTMGLLKMTQNTLHWATTSHSSFAQVTRGFVGLSPEIGVTVTALGGFITNFGKITGAVGSGIKAIGDFGKTSMAVIKIMAGFKEGKVALEALAKSSTLAKVALGALNFVASLNPFAILVISITAVVAALTIFFTTTSRGRKLWKQFCTNLGNWWHSLALSAKKIFSEIGKTISQTWKDVKAGTKIAWNAIKFSVSMPINAIKALFTKVFPAMGKLIANIWNSIKAKTSSVWNGIKTTLSNSWNGLKNLALKAFNAVKTTISNIWNGVKGVTNNVWNGIKGVLSGIWNGLKGVASSAFNAVQSTISNVWSTVQGICSSVWNGIQSTLSGIWNSIKSIATSTFNTIRSNITSAVHNMASNVSEAAHNMMSRFVNAVRSGGERAISGARNIAHNIVSGIKSGLSGLYSAAVNAMQGFVNGIMEMGKRALSAAENIAHNIVSTIKGALDIHSPSKVMRDQVGVWIPAGVAVGMQKNMGVVSKTANDVANAATVTIPAVKTNKFNDSLNAIKKASHDVLGTNLNGHYSLNVNKQPAHINLSLGGHEFETFVSDISKQQGTNAHLQTNYRI